MKRSFLLASAALVALASQAQYNVSNSNQYVIDQKVSSVYTVIISDAAVAEFEKAGSKVTYIGPSPDEGRNLYIWDHEPLTFVPCQTSPLRVDDEEGEALSLEVSNQGWSGAGLNIDFPGIDISSFNDDTRFHMAYMTPTANAPASVAIILFDGDGSKPAKFSVGDVFDDNGKKYPSVGKGLTDEWQAIDMSLGEIRKTWGELEIARPAAWTGNLFSFLGGGVQGTTLAFDAVYFYNIGESGDNAVNELGGEGNGFVVTDKTVSVPGGNGIELYALDGKLVKSATGSVLGLNGLQNGVYVVRCGAKTQKIVVR